MLGVLRVAGQHEQIPGVVVGGVVGVRARAARRDQLDDMAVEVFRPGVGRVELVGRHLLVLGHDGIDAAGHRVGLHVLRAVHRRGAQRIGGKAGLEQHLGLLGKAVLGGQRALAMHQRQPGHRAVGIEPATDSTPSSRMSLPVAGLAGSKAASETKR